MVGKMTFNKTLVLAVCFLFVGCAVKSNLSKDIVKQIAGIYKYKVPYFSEGITLVLKDDFTYLLKDDLRNQLFNVGVQDTRLEEGRWRYSNGNVILNSYLDVDLDDYDSFIDEVRTFGFYGDSIVIQILSLYNNSPLEDLAVLFRFRDSQREDTLLFSDRDGKVCFPRDGVKSVIGIYGLEEIDIPPIGYYYIVHFIDCNFSTHKNEKLQIDGDTLIMHSKNHNGYSKFGWKKYRTYEYPFIKVADTTVFRKK